MSKISTNEFKAGIKIEVEKEPYTIISTDYVNPGKGQAFCRVKLKHLKTHRVIERTFKSGDKVDVADVVESKQKLLYFDTEKAVFMDENTFEQTEVPLTIIGEQKSWLMEETVYQIIFYKGQAIEVIPPTFMEMKIVETIPGARGDTTGRVLKPATTESGAKIQVPLFIQEGEKIKVDTRTGEYSSRV